MQQPIRYSPHPREQYTVRIKGRSVGIGVHPALVHAPTGVWNIVWLSTTAMDQFLGPLPQDVMQLPYTSSILPVAVGTAYQEYQDGHECWWLAEKVPPTEFLDTITSCPYAYDLLLPRQVGRAFWRTARARAAEYHRRTAHANVIAVNFAEARR